MKLIIAGGRTIDSTTLCKFNISRVVEVDAGVGGDVEAALTTLIGYARYYVRNFSERMVGYENKPEAFWPGEWDVEFGCRLQIAEGNSDWEDSLQERPTK